MKNWILMMLGLFCAGAASGQIYYEKAVGLHAGTTSAISYKQFIKGPHAVEGMVGIRLDRGVTFTGLYEYHLDIGFDTGFDCYGGAGISLGAFYDTKPVRFGAGVVAVIGVEYTFRLAPICIGIDYQPLLGYKSSYLEGGLNVRYTFESR